MLVSTTVTFDATVPIYMENLCCQAPEHAFAGRPDQRAERIYARHLLETIPMASLSDVKYRQETDSRSFKLFSFFFSGSTYKRKAFRCSFSPALHIHTIMATPSIPGIVWYSGALVITACVSALVLSVQRGLYHKRIQLEDNTIEHHLKLDVKRSPHVPYADSNRLNRITYLTALLTLVAALNLKTDVEQQQQQQQQQQVDMWAISSSAFIFVSWLYALVLALMSRRYQLPSRWGWVMNVHLCIFYSVAWIVSVYTLWQIASLQDLSWIQCLPYLLPAMLGLDLVFVTMTVKQGPPFLDEHGREVCNINVESIWGILYMNWCTKVVQVVSDKKAQLSDKDLPTLTPSFRAHNLFYTLGSSRGDNLILRLIKGNSGAMIMQVGLSFFASVLYYAPAFFMNRLLQFLQDYNDGVDFEHPVQYGVLIVLGMGASIVVLGIFVSQQWYYASCAVQAKVRSMLHVEIYRKSLRRRDLSVADVKDKDSSATETKENEKEDAAASSAGAIVNLMGTDASRIAEFCALWFVILSAPIELMIGIYFLYQLIGMACIYGLLIMVFILPVNHFNSKYFAKTQDRLMKARDKRVSLMTEVLQGIRQIKFFAWETNWEKRVMEARDAELAQLAITYINGIFFSLVWQGAPILVTLVSFFVFTKIQGNELTAPIAFTVISIFSELRFALNVIPETMIQSIQAYSSIKRIQKFLDEDEIESAVPQNPHQKVELSFDNATIGWKAPGTSDGDVTDNNSSNVEDSFILKEITAKFPNDELSLISGATGAGKTLMLLGLLGESVLLDGKVACPRVPLADTIESEIGSATADIDPEDWILDRALAYVSQTPWLQNASIRNNILFGLPYIESRYKETLSACALDKDMSILEDGDRTEIGEKGITLSGGQKARVALARAVYSRAKNVLMDDVLSAVDAHTAKHLYEQCLMGPLMKHRTRVLVTHHVRLCLKGCGLLVHITGGRASHVGSPAELRESGLLAQIIEEEDQQAEQEDTEEKAVEQVKPLAADEDEEEETAARTLIEEEGRASGAVKFRLYKVYFGMVGKTFFWIIMCLIVFGGRAIEIGESWWVKTWAEAYDHYPLENGSNATLAPLSAALNPRSYAFGSYILSGASESMSITEKPIHNGPSDGQLHLNYYLIVYCLITMSNVIVSALRYGYLYWGALRANKSLYADLLHRVFRAPLRFFDTTPMGRILNRFSKDFEAVDSKIPTDFMSFWITWLAIISAAVTVCCVLPAFILPMVVVITVNALIGMDYVSSSRELKRLDSVTRSPLFSVFTETIAGVATIRAFGATQQFLRTMMDCIDANARPFFYTWSVTRWVSVRYSMSSAAINFAACAFTLWNLGKLDVALAGFGLSFVLMFTDSMFWGIRQYTSLEMSFNAIERIVEFMEIDQEAPAITSIRPPPQWPAQGAIEVKDLEVRYAADLDPVLRDLSFSIKPREKIGIVGRTGSGKSTLALSFFRFVEASAGSIVIDGIDIKDLGTEDLRSNLTIIPQDPTLFSGTLRSNMDPFDQFDDESIYAAFRRVHLLPSEDDQHPSAANSVLESSNSSTHEVNANVFKDLSTMVSEGGKNFSQGQRQLLCLGRALLKRTGIVLMDEATASVDFETDKAIQKTIATEFSDSTILCIAHRLHTVIEYDRILVLDQGRIDEFDNPYTLISNPGSSFYKMCRNSGEFDSLFELAKSKHQLVNV
ncbi:multidrug resistance-associated ABC transporter [Mucor ambiguus]|uniref:Multidrug resistance-associated ABC transporter n=1 Tax=Mucor ambiguus TaxID=91626 RepID=A0A0C9MPR2_9FUNG|nr:multidrug resistance-associated ABC transporter [Mucor ambiguus]